MSQLKLKTACPIYVRYVCLYKPTPKYLNPILSITCFDLMRLVPSFAQSWWLYLSYYCMVFNVFKLYCWQTIVLCLCSCC